MTPVAREEHWEVLEKIGAYAAGELEGEEAREAEQLIFNRPDYRRLAESYARMLVMLSSLSNEPVEVPEVVVSYAVRRAYLSAFLRQAEQEAWREVERLLLERADYRRLAESYARMLMMLSAYSREPVEAPEAVVSYAVRRAYVSAFLRQAETFLACLGRSYLDAFVYYLGLRPARPEN